MPLEKVRAMTFYSSNTAHKPGPTMVRVCVGVNFLRSTLYLSCYIHRVNEIIMSKGSVQCAHALERNEFTTPSLVDLLHLAGCFLHPLGNLFDMSGDWLIISNGKAELDHAMNTRRIVGGIVQCKSRHKK